MTGRRVSSVLLVLAVCGANVGCELVAPIDRDKIDAGPLAAADATVDGAADATVDTGDETSTDSGSGEDTGAPDDGGADADDADGV